MPTSTGSTARADVDDLALHELAAFNGIVLVEWGDVAAVGLGDHLEVRLDARDDRDDDERGRRRPATTTSSPIRVHARSSSRAVGPAWAGRWDRLDRAVEPYRC